MKNTKRLAAMVAAMALTATMAVPFSMTASATSVTVDTTNDSEAATHTYTAYPIFTGTYNEDLGLTVTDWAEGFNSTALLSDTAFKNIVAVKAQGTESAKTIGDILGSKTDAASVAQAIENIGNDSAEAIALAKVLAKYTGTTGTKTLSDAAETLDAGYWIVKDAYTVTDTPTNDAVSAYVLRVSGGNDAITINPKKDKPTVEKKVLENVKDVDGKPTYDQETTEKWNDVADYCIGDSVPFKVYGTLPGATAYAAYDNYYYKFTDTLGAEFNAPEEGDIIVKVNGEEIENEAGKTNMRVTVSGQTITVSFENIKEFAPNATDVITFEYRAVLNTDAKIGLPGQENTVDLTYSNNPNVNYTPDTDDENEDVPKDDNGTPDNPSDDKDATDKTPEDKVIVFTYELDITKQDSATEAKLEDAQFVLYRGTGADTEYAVVDNAGKIVDWLKGTLTVTDGVVSFTKTSSANGTEATEPTVLTSDENGNFKVIGLDDGTYYLKETKAPENYNLLENDITLVISATTANNQAWTGTASDALTGLSGTIDSENMTLMTADDTANLGDRGGLAGVIGNSKGTQLPSTGGMGTRLFVLGGGATAALAGIYLVSRKRTKEEEE